MLHLAWDAATFSPCPHAAALLRPSLLPSLLSPQDKPTQPTRLSCEHQRAVLRLSPPSDTF